MVVVIEDSRRRTYTNLALKARCVHVFVGQMADIQAEFGSPQDVPYWSYHLMRTSFFSVQGAVGVLAAQLQGGSLFKNREGGTDLGAALPAVSADQCQYFHRHPCFHANVGAASQPKTTQTSKACLCIVKYPSTGVFQRSDSCWER